MKSFLPWRRAGFALVVLGCAMAAQAQQQVLQFKWGHVYEPASIFHQQAELAARKIAEQSDGKIKIEVVPASKMGQEADFPLMLANDSMQIAYVGEATLAEGYPPLSLGSYPFAFKDLDHMRKYLASPLLADLMKGYNEKSGNRMVATVYYGARQVTSARPLAKPEDFRDLRLYVPSAAAYQLFATALDAKPVTLPFMSLYGSLKKGEVEAQENPLGIVRSKKLYEVQKYVQLTAHAYDTLGIVIGKAAWARLAPPQQAMVEKVLAETAKWTNVGVIAGELEDEQFLRGKGMTVTPVNRQLFLERIVKRATPEQQGARPGDYAKLQALAGAN
ncbi:MULTISPECIES: sialic acid TRAP transporter substrate-binding protein SiaP [Variovorax]|jgi:tripartite ATP-independent transporter DctP family solute receptor|uniref:sialic acid TRAP transporter substrate-binding protein SiaP n=1 Tax=Variovorax TaxID=34072 RepID=UPI00086E27D9|nr:MULTISPECIES: sialic acid TRAP transporter substrate-binding protein SiaP [Variovorax]MBN8758648.1 sialic acid TRAP transporter substrate-binding protein SiaP [Variovorax sp.]ODU14206.1 MAG: C4-dicarboxylate ABC transporter substrate-binding protein [Variovorax sp. SCN 67-85]ODV25641.1 MAG: C4-dicarboxylate ABC transporter substrate-binding protein [Variovorax sp. SCN 67-20]OJZ08718.1 MAG: C4-dicarboxylate ABC transporter substrate-binding protein [Variovorax sp. 67-131]UKI11105.1 sialic ac